MRSSSDEIDWDVNRKVAENIFRLINDSGQGYFSKKLCGEEKHLEIPVREHPMDEYMVEEFGKHQAKWEIIE